MSAFCKDIWHASQFGSCVRLWYLYIESNSNQIEWHGNNESVWGIFKWYVGMNGHKRYSLWPTFWWFKPPIAHRTAEICTNARKLLRIVSCDMPFIVFRYRLQTSRKLADTALWREKSTQTRQWFQIIARIWCLIQAMVSNAKSIINILKSNGGLTPLKHYHQLLDFFSENSQNQWIGHKISI